MSDDERMDRANRIRRMREGQRTDDDVSAETDDDAPAETDDDTSVAAEDTEAPESVPDTEAGATPNEEPDTVEEEPADTAAEEAIDDEVANGRATDESVEQWDQAVEHPARTGGAEQSQEDSMNESSQASDPVESDSTNEDDQDPQAIAQRAATAAAQVTGGNETEIESTTDSGGSTDAGSVSGSDGTVAETAAAIQDATGVDLPDQAEIEAAVEAAGGSVERPIESDGPDDTAKSPRTAESEATTEASTRVLEFTLGDEHYCIDISLVEEIVKRDSITRVPNTDEYIEGVVDLRGQITTILDPKALMAIDGEGPESLMIVFDPKAFDDQGAIGWVVDEVRQVAPIRDSEVNDPPVSKDYIRGVVDRDESEEFVIWTKPEIAIKLATVEETDE
jgi:purine-binding chemotaxis protein CheW